MKYGSWPSRGADEWANRWEKRTADGADRSIFVGGSGGVVASLKSASRDSQPLGVLISTR